MSILQKKGQIKNTVIAFGESSRIKSAALYSEYVLPICFSDYPRELLPPFMDERDGAVAPIILHLLFIDGVLQQLMELGYEDLVKMESDIISITWHGDRIETLYKPVNGKQEALERALLNEMAQNRQVSPIVWAPAYEAAYLSSSEKTGFLDDLTKHNFTSSKARYFGLESDVCKSGSDFDDAILLSVSNIPLANTRDTDWEQIMALRSDKQAVKQVNSLKAFFMKPLQKRKKIYVEDAIKRRLKNYQKACKKHNVKLHNSTINIYFNKKFINDTCVPDMIDLFAEHSRWSKVYQWFFQLLHLKNAATEYSLSKGVVIELAGLHIEITTTKINKNIVENNKELLCTIAKLDN